MKIHDTYDEYFNIDDLKYTQKLNYGERLALLDSINEFLMKTMSEESKQISLKLSQDGF